MYTWLACVLLGVTVEYIYRLVIYTEGTVDQERPFLRYDRISFPRNF